MISKYLTDRKESFFKDRDVLKGQSRLTGRSDLYLRPGQHSRPVSLRIYGIVYFDGSVNYDDDDDECISL